MKKCSKCGEYKEFELFHKDKRSKDGCKSWCKDCRRKETKEYREKYREKVLEAKRQWYKKTKTEIESRNKRALDLVEKKCNDCE